MFSNLKILHTIQGERERKEGRKRKTNLRQNRLNQHTCTAQGEKECCDESNNTVKVQLIPP